MTIEQRLTASIAATTATPRARDDLQILKPLHRQEVITARKVAELGGVTPVTARLWGERFGLSRRIGGRLAFSWPATLMFIDGDREALKLYHRGERTHPRVASYFARCGIDAAAVFGAANVASVDGGVA